MKQKTPPVDIRKIIRAAAEAALEEPAADSKPKKRRLSSGRALILGAGLMTAGRLAARGRVGNMIGSLENRLADLGVQIPGQETGEPEVADEDVLDEPIEDLDEEPEDELEEEPEDDEEESNGAAPERRASRQSRGR